MLPGGARVAGLAVAVARGARTLRDAAGTWSGGRGGIGKVPPMGDAPAAQEDAGAGARLPAPVLPAYGGGCLTSVVPALLALTDAATGAARAEAPPPWMAPGVQGATQVVLLVLDGLGWEQLRGSGEAAPT